MPEPGLPAHPPNDHLTRKLLRRALQGNNPLSTLLEQLITDTVYTQKNEFDEGIDENRWINGGFVWDPADLQGRIHGTSIPEEDDPIVRPHTGLTLEGRVHGWRSGKRATAMIRLRLASLSGIVEFGFVDQLIVEAQGGVVLDKSTPLADSNLQDFSLAVRDPNDNAFFGIVSLGTDVLGNTDNTIGGGTNEKVVAVSGGAEMTLMLATNEQTETRLWVDGKYTDVERSGPSRTADLGLWLHATSTALDVDYIQSWQERVAM